MRRKEETIHFGWLLRSKFDSRVMLELRSVAILGRVAEKGPKPI
jgi:hypothetical protein